MGLHLIRLKRPVGMENHRCSCLMSMNALRVKHLAMWQSKQPSERTWLRTGNVKLMYCT